MALAIELAAARFPSLGLDGIEAGLADRMRLLAGGRRIDDRHRSLRSTLDWSYALLDEPGQAVLRRVSVFAAPFTASAAAAVLAGWPPVAGGAIPAILAGLADQSLLVAIADPSGTRYRALETIRQYGADRLADAGESVRGSVPSPELVPGRRRCSRDAVPRGRRCLAVGVRSGRRRAARRAGLGGWQCSSTAPEAYRLAIRLAELSFARGMPGESQRRYEQAAGLAADDRRRRRRLRSAAGAAESRHFGDEALRLRRAAADAALRARVTGPARPWTSPRPPS